MEWTGQLIWGCISFSISLSVETNDSVLKVPRKQIIEVPHAPSSDILVDTLKSFTGQWMEEMKKTLFLPFSRYPYGL